VPDDSGPGPETVDETFAAQPRTSEQNAQQTTEKKPFPVVPAIVVGVMALGVLAAVGAVIANKTVYAPRSNPSRRRRKRAA
jgi:hypothetical protein